ncbi:adenosylcobalamin-dependent ribonucleoside-diphosphate reductase [Cyclobacteriaceae bacterium YHN15]|nr:adenosylcobalamin-dependent ribonucleoside-diphosphate reductase [Cyclobacteriaceae bacterium YHN15]
MENLSDNALRILQERYLLKDKNGALRESPEEMFHRVARSVSKAELNWGTAEDHTKWEKTFLDLMSNLIFLPNSPTLMNAGTPNSQLSACFVLPVEDSLSGIFETLKTAALVHQKGGGTGFNFSHLRPAGDRLSHLGGSASGPVSFITLYDFATEQVKQGGKRRGANMGILNVDHPDILEFVRLRVNGKPLQNFNLSVGVSNAFMQAVEKDADWELIHPNSRKPIRELRAGLIWEAIIQGAWESGNPGMIFLDTINESNPMISMGEIEATNPCGEVPLLDFEACNLGSINLSKFIKRGLVDWDFLRDSVHTAIRFLDNVIEVNKYPDKKIRKATIGNRKIGLGVMGWAEMLIQMNISYDSEEAVDLAKKVMKFIQEESTLASSKLAEERGNFENWEKSIFCPDKKMRNATRNSIAPTGTISILANTSSSIEPLFALAFQRRKVLDGQTLTSINDLFLQKLKEGGLFSQEILDQVIADGTCNQVEKLPERFRSVFKTALEIEPEWHLKHQIAFQQFTDNAVSKTVNLPKSATPEDIAEIYKMAWKWKAKGITVFRNDTGREQVLFKGIKAICK